MSHVPRPFRLSAARPGGRRTEGGEKLGSFHLIFFARVRWNFQEKVLTTKVSRFSFDPPKTALRRKSVQRRTRRRGFGSFGEATPKAFLKVFGKEVDEGYSKVLVRNLSLSGKLFEIYFVRLIGTPNQQFKNIRSRLWPRSH
jgi:hypothetical protein